MLSYSDSIGVAIFTSSLENGYISSVADEPQLTAFKITENGKFEKTIVSQGKRRICRGLIIRGELFRWKLST